MKKFLFLLMLLITATMTNAQTVVFHENFEPASNADSVTASGNPLFAINARLFHSGTQCDSSYAAVGDTSYLTTQSFSTVGYPVVYLNFSHICKVQLQDTAKVEVSVNGGPWIKLTTQYINQPGSQFVAQTYHFSAGTYPLVWLPGTPTEKPQQSWWKNEMFDISAIAGNASNVRVRFTLIDNGDGSQGNHGWYIDDINVIGAVSELFPPKLTMKPPVFQDTIYTTGPFNVSAYIKDASGIDTAYIEYKLNGGANQYIPMLWVSDSTYTGTIPSYSYQNRIDYKVFAFDNAPNHNSVVSSDYWFFIKQGPPEVVIGTGTVTTNNYYPFDNYYENNRSQMLYKASEINKSGAITHLAFNLSYITAEPLDRHLLNFTIKIKPTSLTTLGTAYEDMTSATTVFSSADYYQMATTGWHTFDINDFSYNGTDNLIVEVLWGDNGNYCASGDQYNVYRTDYSSGSDVLVVYGYADSETPPLYDGNSKIRPNIKFTFPVANFSQDAGVYQILTPTGLLNTGVNYPVTLNFKNYAVDTLKKVTIAWKLDGVLQTPYDWTGVLMQDVVSTTLNMGNINVSTTGLHTIRAWTELPNDSVDQNQSNDTVSLSFYACASSLSGPYTIGPSGADFPNFSTALITMQNCHVSGPVIFNVQPGTYTEQLNFPEIAGASDTNTITFQSSTGVNTDVTLRYATTSSGNYVVKLDGADHFRFKNMTLRSTGKAYACVLAINGNAINNQFDGNRIIGKDTALNSVNIALVNSASGTTSIDSLSVFNNNTFTGGSYGIYFYGGSSTALENKTSITNNTFTNQYLSGIYLGYHNAPVISGNTITTNSGYTPFNGIYTYYCDNNMQILKNKIVMANGGYGIQVYYCDGVAGKPGLIANNAISIGGSTTTYGIYDNYSSYQNIYYNSVNVYTNYSTARAMYLYGGTTYLNHRFKNNIFAYTGANTSGVSFYVGTPAMVSASDYNDLFSTGTNLGYWSALRANLAAWKTASAKDTNSVSAQPSFFSPTDLHTLSSAINAHATPITGITGDIEGNPRNATQPDIGAYEFDIPARNLGITAVTQPLSSCGLTANETLMIKIKNTGLGAIDTTEVYYILDNGTPVHETVYDTILPDSTYTYTFAQQLDLSATGAHTLKVYIHAIGDLIPLDDTATRVIENGYDFNSGPYTMGFEASENYSAWSVFSENGGTYTYQIPYVGYAHTGSNSARFYNSSSNTLTDWMFSRCFTLEAGKRYQISFWYRAESASYPQTAALKFGNSATPAGMTNTLLTLSGFTNTTYQQVVCQVAPSVTGVYYFGWQASSPPSIYYHFIDDINISIVPDHDGACVSIIAPVTGCSLTNAEPVTVRFKNTGAMPIDTTDLYYVMNNGTPVHETLYYTIQPDSAYSYTFAQTVDMSVYGDYTFDAYIKVPGDTLPANDTVNNYLVNTGFDLSLNNYTMGFEASEDVSLWSKLDVNGDNTTWTYPYSSTTYSRTGSNSARYNYNSSNTADDWLFSRCFPLMAGSTYKIEFWYRSQNTTDIESMELKLGTSATPAAMTTMLVSLPSFAVTTYQKASAQFIVPATGSYYFGWHAYSIANAYNIYIDDINISYVPEQEAALLSIVSPQTGCGLSNAEPVTLQIKNTGSDTIQGNFSGYYVFNGGSVISELITDTIVPGDTIDFSFSQTVDLQVLASDSIFPLTTWISLAGDPFQTNDTLSAMINSMHVPNPPVTINDTVSFGTSATLQAISPDSVYWYDVPVGGVVVGTGHTFVTPPLFNMGVYYAEVSTMSGSDSLNTVFNGSTTCAGGNMFDLEPLGSNLSVTGFNVRPNVAGAFTVGVYTKQGSYSGSEITPAAWTLLGTYNASSTATGAMTYVDVDDFLVLSGQVTGVYLYFNATYSSLTSVTTYTNTDLKLTSGVGLCSLFGDINVPRGFNGTVLYDKSGCPSARVPDTAFLSLYPKEASIVSVTSPVAGCNDGVANISVLVSNNGMDTLTGNLTVNYTVNGSPVVSEIIPGTIYPGDTVPYTFTSPLTTGLSQANLDTTFNLVTYIELAGDPYPANDTLHSLFDMLYTPPAPAVANITIPYATTGTIHAVSSDSVSWFDVPTGGTAISNSAYFTTPVLYNTTVYYAEAVSGSLDQHVGPFDNTIGGGGAVDYSYYLIFDVLSSIVNIKGVYVYPGASGDVVLYIANSSGTVLTTITYPVTTPNVKTYIPVDYDLPAGTNYRMGFNSASPGVSLYRNTDGAAYPYTLPGVISITGNSFTGYPQYYYYFYDWVVGSGGSGCTSTRVADTVFVSGVPACDVSVLDIYEPNTGIELSTTEPVTVKIRNYGSAPAVKVPIHYTVNGGTPVNDTVQGPVASNDTAVFTFAVTADLSVIGTHVIEVYTDMACDATHVNDTAQKTVICQPLAYCTSTSTSPTSYGDIGNVTLSNINNGIAVPVTNNASAINGYSDFTASLPAVQLNSANTYPISVSIISHTTFSSTYVKTFIDYNRDGVLDPTAELVFGALATATAPTVTGNITIPVTAVIGLPLRMRVVAEQTTVASNVEPCGNYLYGETEDYTVMISPQIPHDAGAITVIEPLATETEGESVPVRVIIKNFGSDTIHNTSNMMVAYSHNGGAVQSLIWNGGDILPLATDTVVLPDITVTANANTICARTQLPGDIYAFNDTVCKNFHGTPLYDAGVIAFLQPANQLVSNTVETVSVIFRNFGADTLTSLNLAYSVNGVVQATQPWTGSLLPNGTDTVTFTQTFTVPSLGFDLCAYTSLTTDPNHGNDTLCITPFGVISSTLPYYDNFDGPVVYWSQTNATSTSITKWELGQPGYGTTNSVHSAPNAWDVNLDTNYFVSANTMLYTQYFDFSSAVNARMKFWINYNVESGYDGTRIDYTTDNGVTWNVLGIYNDPQGLNWYNDETIVSSGNQPGWTGTSSGWKYCEYKLGILNNVPMVRFRFVFTSDGSVNYDGVSVDDFAITLPYPQDAGVQLIKTPAVQAPAGSSAVVKARIKNFGTDTLHSIPVSYRLGLTGTPVTQTWTGTLNPEDTTTLTFTAPMTIPAGAFDLYAYTGLSADGDHVNDTAVNHITGVPFYNVPYSDDYEGLVTWFGAGTSNLWEWGVPAATLIDSAYSPTHAWVTNLDGDYINSAIEYLYSPLFMFTGVDSAYLEFWHWYDTETNYDGGQVEYSINNGTWTTLGTLADPNGVNWYNSTASGFPCWAGSSNGYVYSKYRLTAIPNIVNATTPVQFRFKFFSDVSGVNEGWAIDNFAITAPPIPQDAGVIAILQPNAATQTGSPVTVQVTIKNFGTANLTSFPVRYVVNNGAVTSETWTGSLTPGNTVNYTFSSTYASPATTYNLCAFTKATGDIYTFNDTICASFGTTPAPHDVGISAILAPGATTIFGQADTVKVRIKNYGLGVETSIPLVYLRNSVQVGAGVWTGTLNGGDSVDYAFTTLNVSPIGNYSLCAKTTLTGDANSLNDQVCIYPYGQVGIESYDYSGFVLYQNVPNPAGNLTDIVFYVPESDRARFEMYDVLGKAIRAEDMDVVKGENRINLNAAMLPDGIYFYSVSYQGEKQTKRMVIAR
ncbi:MAG TPA: CARDB domain-containing protein [Bacteroidales bacterium]|nr:CARDB domain-containing protein [Bacteroidales bacterium]